jgi:polyisoprenoid-binding protein YceI
MKQLTVLIILFGINQLFAQSSWNIDPSHSSITFSVGYLGISDVTGSFKKYDGNIKTTSTDFSDAKISFTVDVSSIDTDIDARDNHLKSPDFFDAAKFSKMSFESTAFKKKGKNKFLLEGNLSIKGTSKKVSFEVTSGGTAKDNYGNERVGMTLFGKVKRSDYQINGGQGFVGDEVSFALNFNFIKSK